MVNLNYVAPMLSEGEDNQRTTGQNRPYNLSDRKKNKKCGVVWCGVDNVS